MKTRRMLGPLSQQLLLLLLWLLMPATTEGAITCRAVTSRYETSVTCDFGVNIFETKHNFNLQFYYPDLHADPATPLMCNWMTSGKINCKKRPGIEFNNVIADQVTIRGPPALDKLGGKYVCQVLPTLNVPIEACNLTFTDVTTTSTTTTTTTTTTTSKAMLEEMADNITTSIILSVLALTVSLIVLLIIIIILIIVYRSRAREWIKVRRGSQERVIETGTTEPLLTGQPSEGQVTKVQLHQGVPGPSDDGQHDEKEDKNPAPKKGPLVAFKNLFKSDKPTDTRSKTMDPQSSKQDTHATVPIEVPSIEQQPNHATGERGGKDSGGGKGKSQNKKKETTKAEVRAAKEMKSGDNVPQPQETMKADSQASGDPNRAAATGATTAGTEKKSKTGFFRRKTQ